MDKIKHLLTSLGFEEWAFLLCGVGSVVIALLDFTQVVHLTNEDALRMIIVAIGLLMSAVAAQSGRRTAELRSLRDSLGATSIELVNISERRLYSIWARKFILDTTLHLVHASDMTHPADIPNHLYYSRVIKNEITVQKIEAIPSKERLEYVISRLVIYEGVNYFVRYYDAPAKPIPVLNLMSIDNEVFYLGTFYTSTPPAGPVRDAVIRGPEMEQFFEAYWNNLWHSATPLNEGKQINWDELKAIAHRVGMSEEEFNSIVSKWQDEIQRRKRRGR